jgi:hypothetical protein
MRLKNRNTLGRKKCEKALTNPIPLPVVFLRTLIGRSPDS